MDWTPGGTSEDIEDRRNESGGAGGGFNLGGGGGFGGIHLGIGGFILVGILSLVFRTNLFNYIGGGGEPAAPERPVSAEQRSAQDQRDKPKLDFISFVLDDIQHTWDRELPQFARVNYHHAKLVLFRNQYPSACGTAKTAVGPFYCPADEKVYLDLSFLDELKQRFGAPGEFAQAYVVAHEIGHHVQKLLGTEQKVHRLQQSEPGEANHLSVDLELQADCYAGVWAETAEGRAKIQESDIDSALGAAAAVGDDRLQKAARGSVNPETFTHGSSAQRQHWFRNGLQTGTLQGCNTFNSSTR